jgi:DNA-binding beta-propeller fold protein YncE
MFKKMFLLFFASALLLGAVVSCASRRAIIDRTAVDKILWPGTPEKPRIKYQWSLSVVSGRESDSMYDVLFGKRDDLTDPRTSNRLLRPYSIFVDEGQKLYISDPGAYRVTVIDMNTGESFHITSADKTEFLFPVGVVAYGGRIYVSDSLLNKVFILDEMGKMIGDFRRSFARPTSLAIDKERGVIYVSDTLAHRIYKYTSEGENIGSIGIDGSGEGEFNYPTHIWVDRNGVLYVTDSMNFRVQMFSPEGKFTGMFGTHGDSYADLDKPKGIAADSDENIYIVDSIHDVIKIFDHTGRLLLFFGRNGGNYGEFSLPSGIFIDAKNNIYVGDTYNGRVQVFKYMSDN